MEINLENSLGHKMEVSARLMNNRVTQRLENIDVPITSEQWALLNILFDEDGKSQNQLAKIMFKDHTSISRIVDNLIKKSLVIRKLAPNDRRTNLIYMTDVGKNIQEQATKLVENQIDISFQGISEEQLKICSDVLSKVIQNLK